MKYLAIFLLICTPLMAMEYTVVDQYTLEEKEEINVVRIQNRELPSITKEIQNNAREIQRLQALRAQIFTNITTLLDRNVELESIEGFIEVRPAPVIVTPIEEAIP